MERRYLFIIDRAPYGDWSGRETLDMALSAAAFDQPVSLAFSGQGVHWLRAEQAPQGIEQKTGSRNLAAASLFGIEALYVPQSAFDRFGTAFDSGLEITPVASLAELAHQFSDVVRL
ncbi:DsrE family protein [Marinobacter sp. JSM 1782161]|uniref:DsrE family protein n=1 Tax=Marinobacter sp. JSM 1782161 TaxID=2685906 RepID=UPI001401FC29|nr:DsrE family protein [Marinobacter sp. JSM 1782161]